MIPSWKRLFEMSNFNPKTTGLKEVIYVSVKQGSHGPRLKVFKDKRPQGENFTVTIDDNPKTIGKVFVDAKELKRIIEFIQLNKEILIAHWNFEADSAELTSGIKKLNEEIEDESKN